MPKLWTDTIDEHRQQLREAILDTVAVLVAEHGLLSVTMSGVAERTGVGRATLYKYFPDVESVLRAWHERQVGRHLTELSDLAVGGDSPLQRLRAVLSGYAHFAGAARGHNTEISAALHRGTAVSQAETALRVLVTNLIAEAATAGEIRRDIPAAELANFCLHALTASGGAACEAAVQRLIDVTLAGLAADGTPV